MDTIGDFLTTIRNGIMASKPFVIAPYTKMKEAIANILKAEGFVQDVVILDKDTKRPRLQILLKYVEGESVIHDIQRVSKLSRRIYAGAAEIQPVIGGLGLSILSTSHGVVSHKQAKKLGVGGEILCTVW